MHYHLSRLNGRERQRDLMAQAERLRLARQLRHPARASRAAGRHPRPAWPAMLTRLRYRAAQ
jgi:hypothetical protein